MSVLIFILILSIIVFVHELGHYLAARWSGVFVEEFAIGMGYKVFSWKGKQHPCGERTVYSIRILPIGGFCKMRGEVEDDADITTELERDYFDTAKNNVCLTDKKDECIKTCQIQDTSFFRKSPLKRIWVTMQGAVFNLLIAFIAFFLYASLTGYLSTTVAEVLQDSPANLAGLQKGDVIKRIDSQSIRVWDDVSVIMMHQNGNPLDVVVVRDGIDHKMTITPVQRDDDGFMLGLNPDIKVGFLHKSVEGYETATVGMIFLNAFNTLRFNMAMPFDLLSRVIQDKPISEGVEVSGPIGIANAVSDLYHETLQYGTGNMLLSMLYLLGVLSTAIGVMNLLPIPALDGARIVFIFIELIRRKPVKRNIEAMVHGIGFAVLMCLTVFIAYLDITKLF